MRNIIQQQDDLKNLSRQQLVTAMQSGTYPQFLVLSELNRRKRMTDDQARREAVDDTNTVAQEVVNAAGVPQGGIAQLASAMNAKTDNTQNTGVMQMAEGGVVKAQPGGFMSNVLSLMNPYSVKNITDYNPIVAKEPEMTALEALETTSPEVEAALEISRRAQEGEVNIDLINKIYGGTKKFADFLAGSIGILGYEGTRATLETIARFTPNIDTRKSILRQADYVEKRRNDFIKNGTLAYSNAFAEQGMSKEEAEAAAKEKIKQDLAKSSLAAIRSAAEEGGDKTVFAEGTPSVPLTGTYKLPRTFAGTNVGPFGEGPAKFTMGDRSISQGDVFPSGPLAVAPKPESAVRSNVAEEISRLGSPIQTSISQQPPSVSSIIKPPLADDPFRLEGAAKKEQLRNILSDPSITGIPDYLDKVQNAAEKSMSTDYRKDLRDRMLDLDISRRSMEEYFPSGDDPRSKAIADLNRRALRFLKTDTFTPPSEIYGNTDVYGPELGALFDQTLKNQQAGIPGGNTPEATMAMNLENAARLREENLVNPQLPLSLFERAKMYLEGLGRDIRGMTQEDVIEFAKSLGAKGLDLVDEVAQTGSDMLTTRANNKASKAFDAEDVAVGSEPPNFKEIDRATAKQLAEEQDATDTASQTQIDKLMELLNKQQGAIDKQSEASSAALSEYLGGLEKDREFDKAMALANAGAALMLPSATIGEGFGKAIQAGTKTLQKGKDSYNKNKLQVLALQGRIDAAKAAAANRAAISGATLSSRILLKRREELAEQLERIAPMGTNPEGPLADRAAALRKAIKETDDQLNSMIMTASLGSTGAGSDIFASYNLTG